MTVPPLSLAATPTAVPCRRCRYDLRGLRADGRCPECGGPIRLSAPGGDRLAVADPAWLARVRDGVDSVLWGVLVGVGSCVGGGGGPVGDARFWVFGVGFGLCGGGLYATGAWRLSAPDPGWPGWGGGGRRLIRCALPFAGIRLLLAWAEHVGAVEPMAPWPALAWATDGLTAVAVAGTVAIPLHLARLIDRVPDGRLARRARVLAVGLATSLGVVCGCNAVVRHADPLGGGIGWPAAVPYATVSDAADTAGFGAFGVGLACLFLLRRTVRVLGGQAAIARRVGDRARPGPAAEPPGSVEPVENVTGRPRVGSEREPVGHAVPHVVAVGVRLQRESVALQERDHPESVPQAGDVDRDVRGEDATLARPRPAPDQELRKSADAREGAAEDVQVRDETLPGGSASIRPSRGR